jgi:hypothetical protein
MGEKGVGLLIVLFQQHKKIKSVEQWCFSIGGKSKVLNNGVLALEESQKC